MQFLGPAAQQFQVLLRWLLGLVHIGGGLRQCQRQASEFGGDRLARGLIQVRNPGAQQGHGVG